MPDRLTGLEVFAVAIREGGLSAAARALRMSPAMAAKHLDALEQRIGTKLVHRTTRRLSLTEAGRQFLDRAEAVLDALADAEREAGEVAMTIAGRLRVSCPVAFGVRHIAPTLGAFAQRYPALHVELGLTDRHVDLLEEGWDTAVRIGVLPSSELIARRVAKVTTVLAAAPGYLTRKGTPRTVDDLTRHACLGYSLSRHLGPDAWHFGADGKRIVDVSGPLSADNGEALVAAAVAGAGIAYVPNFLVADELRDGRLVAIDLGAPPVALGTIYLVTHPSRRAAAKTRVWIDYIHGELSARAAGF